MKTYKNVLIVLGCAPRRDGRPSACMISRVRKAVQLCRKNNYSKILLSGGPTRGVPESEVMRIMMLKFVEPGRMITERHSRTTVQNAVFCWNILKDRKPRRITIVTSRHHLPRARHVFSKLYSHMGASLKFEQAQDTFDPIEGTFYRLKEIVLLAKLKVFGIR